MSSDVAETQLECPSIGSERKTHFAHRRRFFDPGLFGSYGGVRQGRRLADSRQCELDVPPAEAFAPIRRIGGRTGWYSHDWLWRVRGFIDLLLGGVGVRRGRPDPEGLSIGDTVDWWRVEEYEPDHLRGGQLRYGPASQASGCRWESQLG